MSDGLLAKQAHMNAGAIPTSAEDLAQKHQALLHEYSRLKAKHTVLKKAVIKEQSTNNALQGSVKEKEKELRKLQEQLDLLAFHNERLTKRIEAVQDHEQKGSHFSLLGGAMKKELERSTKALDAANLDLSKKIEENERLHEELSENHHIYTNHVNELHTQIAKLEKQVEELQVEISTVQKDRRDQVAALKQEKTALQNELDKLKLDLADKSRLLKENETSLKQDGIDLRSELESLRAILLAKAGDLENQDKKADIPKLADVVPASDALKILEQQARDYIYALREQTSLKGLPHEIAAKLKTSTETWSEQLEALAKKLEESKEQLRALSQDKERSELASAEQLQKITDLEKTVDELRLELSQKQNAEQLERLEKENKSLKQEIEQLNEQLRETQQKLEFAKEPPKQTLDKETQADLSNESSEEKFVYPTEQKAEEEEEEEEEDEVFVYSGQDAPAEAKKPESNHKQEETSKERELELQAYYESQIRQLTEKLQMADGKAARFARLVDTLKERVAAETDENTRLAAENERLQKECAKVQELLTTTETNYQSQIDVMTEYITQLQQQQQQFQGQR